MKKRITLLFTSAVFIIGFFSACNSGKLNERARTSAEAFYKSLQEKKYDSALELISSKGLEADSKEKWIRGFERNNTLLGKLISFTKTSDFNIQTSMSIGTTVIVAYETTWQYGISKDSLTMIEDKGGSMKIYNYHFRHQKADYISAVSESEKQAGQYMNDVKSGNYDAAIDFCAESALAVTPRGTWKKFLDNASRQLGPVKSFDIVKDSSTYAVRSQGQAGPGNYYDIYIKSNRANNTSMEKIVFYQKDYEMPVKLVGHTFL